MFLVIKNVCSFEQFYLYSDVMLVLSDVADAATRLPRNTGTSRKWLPLQIVSTADDSPPA